MGEATYYLKATFKDEKTLNSVFDKIRKFIKQGQKSEEFWQQNRDEDINKKIEFWTSFKKKFPLVYKYLEFGNYTNEDYNNDLAGILDFGMESEKPLQTKNILRFSARVWHFADWNLFSNFLKKEFGALKVKWLSDEYSTIGDFI